MFSVFFPTELGLVKSTSLLPLSMYGVGSLTQGSQSPALLRTAEEADAGISMLEKAGCSAHPAGWHHQPWYLRTFSPLAEPSGQLVPVTLPCIGECFPSQVSSLMS